MAIFFVRILIFAALLIFATKQVFLPLWRGDKLFPLFRKDPPRVGDAERALLEAKANLQAAKLNKEAEALNTEAWSIEEELYKDKLGEETNK